VQLNFFLLKVANLTLKTGWHFIGKLCDLALSRRLDIND
jgi:hypothetical protein